MVDLLMSAVDFLDFLARAQEAEGADFGRHIFCELRSYREPCKVVCLMSSGPRPNIVSHILEFVGEVVTADDSDSTSERVTLTEAALSTCTSIEWVSRQLRSFLKS